MNENTSRRRFQISLRSIFVLMLIAAAYFAGYRTAVRQTEQAQQAEQAEREARLEAERAAAQAKEAQENAARLAYFQAVLAAQNQILAQQRDDAAKLRERITKDQDEHRRKAVKGNPQ
jgi:hypothetical protein